MQNCSITTPGHLSSMLRHCGLQARALLLLTQMKEHLISPGL
uniref:Testis cDNA clone: QtsA-13157, similar to human chromosome 14 open reading frame 125 (C14orf125) n=1 Tax=Macaca fascicularis TaxID=9541 RepID=Q4R880_MACFA|nr:unnamed protein product [Macaca fascicularis]